MSAPLRSTPAWVFACGPLAAVLLALTPWLASRWPPVLIATYLHLPVYMLHQLEEHYRDRFRLFVNATVGQGRELLTSRASLLINVPGVWGALSLAVYLALGDPAWALTAAYLVLVNATLHISHAALIRRYVPGLATALTLFLPLGLTTLRFVSAAGAGAASDHAWGVSAAVLLHLTILLFVVPRWPARRA